MRLCGNKYSWAGRQRKKCHVASTKGKSVGEKAYTWGKGTWSMLQELRYSWPWKPVEGSVSSQTRTTWLTVQSFCLEKSGGLGKRKLWILLFSIQGLETDTTHTRAHTHTHTHTHACTHTCMRACECACVHACVCVCVCVCVCACVCVSVRVCVERERIENWYTYSVMELLN
jgi:hypothetical protein